jgi:hypothetical protein
MQNWQIAKVLRWTSSKAGRITKRMEEQGLITWVVGAGWVHLDEDDDVEAQPTKRTNKTDTTATREELAKMPPLWDDEAAVCAAADIADGIANYPLPPNGDHALVEQPEDIDIGVDALIRRAEKFLSDRVVLPDARFLLPMVLWACHTHCWGACQFELPYLFFCGVSGSGKNRAMGLVGSLAHEYKLVSKATEAAMRDIVDELRPTLGVEECERDLRNHNSYVHILFNAGYVPNAIFTKKVGGKNEPFSIYCPKMATSISDSEESLRSRCILIPMSVGTPTIDDRISEADDVGKGMRVRLGELVAKHEDAINQIYHRTGYFKPDERLIGRDWQIWQPLYAICQILIPDRMQELQNASTFCASYKTRPLKTVRDMHILKADADLVLNCRRLVQDAAVVVSQVKGKNISTNDLIAGLLALPHGWWVPYQCIDSTGRGIGIGDGQSGQQTVAKMFKIAAGDIISAPIPRYMAPGVTKHGYAVDEIKAAAQINGNGKGGNYSYLDKWGKGVISAVDSHLTLPPTLPQRVRQVPS